MSKQEKRVPEVRFKGFTDDWEQRKLGEIAEIIGGGTPSTSNKDYWGVDIDWYSPVEIGGQTFVASSQKKITELGLQKSSAKILPIGTVLFTSRAGIGNTAILAKEGATNQGFQSIVPRKGELDSYFIYSRTPELKRYGEKNGAGSTFVEVSGKQMAKMPMLTPSLEEQKKVGAFFNQLDTTLALHQRKLELLKQLKQGYLQNLFPSKGESVPKIRFTNFHKKWEQRKLGDIADIIGGGTPSTIQKEYWDGDINWYSPAEIEEQIYINDSRKKITKLGLQKSSAKILPIGTVLFTSRAGIGNTAILEKEGSTNQGFQSIVPYRDVLDSYFIFSRSHELKRYGIIYGAGSTFVEISGKQMEKMPMLIPSIEEQRITGEFLSELDYLITFHQSKLRELERFKKVYLQKLFI